MTGSVPDTLSNHCEEFTKYFACQQTVNGKVGALIVFVYGGKTGHYNTQALLPDGAAQGRGDLLIEGQRWTFQKKKNITTERPTSAPSMTGTAVIKFISKSHIPRMAKAG